VVEVFKAEDGFFRGDGVHRELYQYVHIRLWLCLLFEKNSRKCANTQAACVYSKPPRVHQSFALRGERNWRLKRTKITQGLCRYRRWEVRCLKIFEYICDHACNKNILHPVFCCALLLFSFPTCFFLTNVMSTWGMFCADLSNSALNASNP
jgi:hypothetical protein